MFTSLFYLCGLWFYVRARREAGGPVLKGGEWVLLVLFAVCGAVSLELLATEGLNAI